MKFTKNFFRIIIRITKGKKFTKFFNKYFRKMSDETIDVVNSADREFELPGAENHVPLDQRGNDQSMSPIANIEIAIAIPIFTKNCDRDPDPDRHLKNDRRSRSRS